MNATSHHSTQKNSGSAVAKNSALPDSKKVNSQTNSSNGKLKSTANLKEELQISKNQEGSYPEFRKEKLSEKRQFEKIQSHDSSETTISYSHKSNANTYDNTKKNDFLQEKKALDEKINHLKIKQELTKSKASREYENRGRELERLKEELELINKKIGTNNSGTTSSSDYQEFDSTSTKKIEEIYSIVEFNEIVKAIQLIEDEIIKIEENNDGSEKIESDIKELEKNRSHLIGLMEKFTQIFETEKYDTNPKKSDLPIDNKPKLKRTSPVPRTADAERKVARSNLINKSSDQSDYYQDLCSKFKFCLEKITKANDRLEKVNSKNEDNELKNELRRQYKILGNLAEELQALSSEKPDIPAPANDIHNSTLLLEKVKSEKTRGLEGEYNAALLEYKKELDSYSVTWLKSIAGKIFTGPLAFLVSFGTSNFINRLAPPAHQRWISYSISPMWAAVFHGLFAGPIANQCLSRMWTSPILGEMTNYFRLLGNYGAARWKGELDKEKFKSKKPENAEKLTIEGRWAEERSVFKITPERIKTEETGFFAFSLNYILKSIGPTVTPTVFAPASLITRGYDVAAHTVAGTMASIENVFIQQYLRCLDPKAEEKILPTREISGKEAAKLKSLEFDLRNAINSEQYKNDPNAQHVLARLLHQTSKAAVVAERKSKFLGTLRHELMESLKDGPSRLNMTSEILGRYISLMFVSGMAQVAAELRHSTNPGLRFLGHMIPAIDLIAPPGWAFRGLYSGYILTLLHMVYEINKSDEKKPDTVTRIPTIAQNAMDGTIQSAEKSDTENFADDDNSIIIEMTESTDDLEDWDGNPLSRDERAM